MEKEKDYVEKVNDWLNADPATRSIEEGAKLMVMGNRNKILYKNVIYKNNFEKVEYELRKIVGTPKIEVTKDLTADTIQQMEKDLPDTMETLEKVLSTETKGKRPDHDTLPPEIKSCFENNLEIYPKMRSIQERLKVLSETGTPEERLPFLTELLDLDVRLHANWIAYDSFDVTAKAEENKDASVNKGIDAKRVSANRKYLSDNKAKLTALITAKNDVKAAELLKKMQLRCEELLATGD